MNLTQMTIICTTVGKNPIDEMELLLELKKSPKWNTWMQSHKQQNDLCSFPRQTIQYHGIPSLYLDQ